VQAVVLAVVTGYRVAVVHLGLQCVVNHLQLPAKAGKGHGACGQSSAAAINLRVRGGPINLVELVGLYRNVGFGHADRVGKVKNIAFAFKPYQFMVAVSYCLLRYGQYIDGVIGVLRLPI